MDDDSAALFWLTGVLVAPLSLCSWARKGARIKITFGNFFLFIQIKHQRSLCLANTRPKTCHSMNTGPSKCLCSSNHTPEEYMRSIIRHNSIDRGMFGLNHWAGTNSALITERLALFPTLHPPFGARE